LAETAHRNLTQILQDLKDDLLSHAEAVDQAFPVVYSELRRIASGLMLRERVGHTLQPTAVVHEAYCRLVDQTNTRWQDRAHFIGIAARAMRQILVDYARRRAREKREGAWQRVTLHDQLENTAQSEIEVLELDEALTKLGKFDDRMARVVELRFFGGLTAEEIGHVLGVTRRTVQNDWRVAKLWLTREIVGRGPS
jgi:RNA polymerase sigma factor (TIGR02999 family)